MSRTRERDIKFRTLVGTTLISIVGLVKDGNCVLFRTSLGRIFKMYHQQDCCESVYIEDVIGDVECLLDTPILLANVVSSEADDGDTSSTWTFYNVATVRGHVCIRWLGESNGYYSEGVDFVEVCDE